MDWLLSTLETQDRFFWDARVTASPQGRRRSTGQWSRPDVTSIEVWRSEWLPQVNLSISSYEVKRFCDAERLESNAMEKRAFDATDWAAVNRDICYGA